MDDTYELTPLTDKAVGTFLGAAIGDALGWPQEQNSRNTKKGKRAIAEVKFKDWKRRAGNRYYPFEEVVHAGEYSDDTQLLLATARSLRKGGSWSKALYKFELPFWLSYERGGGGATKRAAECWLTGRVPWLDPEYATRYFQAGGNGVAMRIAPHVFIANQTLPNLLKQVMLNGIATHGHPRALVGALAYAYALWVASRLEGTLEYGGLIKHLLGESDVWGSLPVWDHGYAEWLRSADTAFAGSYKSAWGSAIQEMLDGLNAVERALQKGALAISRDVFEQLDAFNPDRNGAGTTTTVIALYIASRYAADPVTGVLEGAFAQGTDSDTIASMAGGLLGAIRGSEWIHPHWRQVQDAEYITTLAVSMLQENPLELEPIPEWNKRAAANLFKTLSGQDIHEVNLSLLGTAKVLERVNHPPLSKSSRATSWKVTIGHGQTLYLTKLSRVEDGPSEASPAGASTPAAAEHSEGSGASDAAGVDYQRLVTLFEELTHSFPPHMPAAAAFEALTEVVRQLPTIRQELSVRADASKPERDAWLRTMLESNRTFGRYLTVRELKQVLTRLFTYLGDR